jgi:hypothetical protein
MVDFVNLNSYPAAVHDNCILVRNDVIKQITALSGGNLLNARGVQPLAVAADNLPVNSYNGFGPTVVTQHS